MIRAVMSDGRFLLGIDAENVRRLKAGLPIQVDLAHMGGHDKVVIIYGDTMADIARELEFATGEPLPPAQPFHDPSKGQQ